MTDPLNPTTPAGFFEKLMDFSFSQFITASIIKVLYILGIILAGLGALAMLITGLMGGGGAAIGALVIAPLTFIISVIWLRVLLEMVIVIFRIGENTAIIARNAAPPPPPPAG